MQMSYTLPMSNIDHLGMSSVQVTGAELNGIEESLEDASLVRKLLVIVAFEALLVLIEPSMKPGGVSSFSLSRMGLESISITCGIGGLRFADAWVQKRATLMYRSTSSSGYSLRFESTSSFSLPSS